MIIEPLIEADSLREIQLALRAISSNYWQAQSSFYVPYDGASQKLRFRDQEWSLDSGTQLASCALDLRPVRDQALAWPEAFDQGEGFRLSLPIFSWGSLIGVWCLSFETDPGEIRGLDEVERALGIMGEKVLYRERTSQFMERCREFFVQAVEVRGQKSHIQSVSRLCNALASMLDCSAQIKAFLLEAAQYHDIGLLSFEDFKDPKAQREHPMVGAGLLRCHPDSHEVASLVENHHERFDGSGTPVGKRGDELPLEAWILSLVEDFVEHWESTDDSVEHKIRDYFTNKAKHHHPDVVDALCGLVDSERLLELI